MNSYSIKSLFIAIIVLTINLTVEAQVKGDKAVGANLVFTSPRGAVDILGAGAMFRYNLSNFFRIGSTFNYGFEKNFEKRWDLNINCHFLIPLNSRIKIYPLSGMGILIFNADYPIQTDEWGYMYGGKKTSTYLGINWGAGFDYKISSKLTFNAEWDFKMEATLNDALTYSYIMAGIAYNF